MPSELTLDQKIQLCRDDLERPDFPAWAKAARLHQLACLLAERDELEQAMLEDLERCAQLPDERYPHFTALAQNEPRWIGWALGAFLVAAAAYLILWPLVSFLLRGGSR